MASARSLGAGATRMMPRSRFGWVLTLGIKNYCSVGMREGGKRIQRAWVTVLEGDGGLCC